jgi:hypothetical protein
MIIDGHVHVHPDPKGFGRGFDASLERLIKNIKNSPVNKAVLLPINPQIPNKFIADACKEYPNELIGFASVDPSQGYNAAEQLKYDIKKYNLKGLKLHPRLQHFDLSDKLLLPIFKKCETLKIPVVIDAFPGATDDGTSIPYQIGKIAQQFPNLKIVIAHAGGYKILDALFVAKNNKNIYLDISYSLLYFKSSSVEKDLIFTIKKLGANRCIYGSDHPEHELSLTFNQVEKTLKKCHVTESEQVFIFGETIRPLLGL